MVTHLCQTEQGGCLAWSPGGAEGGWWCPCWSGGLLGSNSRGGGEILGLGLEFKMRPVPGPSCSEWPQPGLRTSELTLSPWLEGSLVQTPACCSWGSFPSVFARAGLGHGGHHTFRKPACLGAPALQSETL